MATLRSLFVMALFSLSVLAWRFPATGLEIDMQVPHVAAVEAQPLLAQVKRVQEALEMLGDPLPSEVVTQLQQLKPDQDGKTVSQAVQKALDPLCLAMVEISRDQPIKVIPMIKQPELVEQGWRTFLVKVINHAQNSSVIQYDSPNAKPVPRSEQAQVEERWLDIAPVQAQPLLAKLSGLGLEYRVLQLYCRDRGERKGRLLIKLGDQRAELPLNAMAKPATKVSFQVREVDGTPCMGCFEIRDQRGRVYPSMSKRLAPDFFFHPQVYRESGEFVLLPTGNYTVRCSRGPESIPDEQKITVGEAPQTVSYQVRRWIDPSKLGWWSGDHHIHAAGCAHYENPTQGVHPPDMMRHCLGEDLKVGCCLTWGPCFDYQKRFFSGRPDPVSKAPYLLRYDVEVSGFGSHQSGHLCLLRLREQMYPGGESKHHWPTLGLNTLRWAKKQGAICGPAHSGNGLTAYVGRVEGGKDGPHRLPNFNIPAYNGIGANEFVMNITHEVPGPEGKPAPAVDFISAMDTDRVAEWNMWYHSLNSGFRVKVSGETDFPCIYGQRVGIGRVYCKQKGLPNYDEWCQAIGDGKSYVSDGSVHLMDFQIVSPKQIKMGEGRSEMQIEKPEAMTFQVQVATRRPGRESFEKVAGITLPKQQDEVELIENGLVVGTKKVPANGEMTSVNFENISVKRSAWYAVRVFPHAHTNPIWVIVDGKPIREKASLEWCLKGVDQCWKEKKRSYQASEMKHAEEDYEHARRVYRERLKECEVGR